MRHLSQRLVGSLPGANLDCLFALPKENHAIFGLVGFIDGFFPLFLPAILNQPLSIRPRELVSRSFEGPKRFGSGPHAMHFMTFQMIITIFGYPVADDLVGRATLACIQKSHMIYCRHSRTSGQSDDLKESPRNWRLRLSICQAFHLVNVNLLDDLCEVVSR